MSRRRPNGPSSPEPQRLELTLPPPADPFARSKPTASTEGHRLAAIAFGDSGNHGNQLADLLARAERLVQAKSRPEVGDPLSEAAELRRRNEEAWRLADAAATLREAEYRAAIVRRRVEREAAARRRLVDIEERRARGGMYAGIKRNDRPTHVEVDPEAWLTVKRWAIGHGIPLADVVGELVASAAEDGIAPQRRPQRTRSGRRGFARVRVDDDTWRRFRERAVDAQLTTARALGIVAEAEARRLGWRPGGER